MKAHVAGLVLLLVAAPAMAWSQSGGDAAHSGTAPLSGVEWDVLEVIDLSTAHIERGGLMASGEVLFAIESRGSTCQLAQLHPTYTVLGDAYPCAGGRLVAMTTAGPLGCLDVAAGETYMVQWSTSGSEAWAVASSVSGLPGETWQCGLPAVAGSSIIVPIASPTQHRIEWVSLSDGEVTNTASIPITTFAAVNETASAVLAPLTDATAAISGFQPRAVTVTDDALVVVGRFGPDQSPAAAAMAMDGTLLGGIQWSSELANRGAEVQPMSEYAVARDELAAIVMGDLLLSIDAGQGNFRFTPLGPTALGATVLPAPAWNRDVLVLPSESGAYIARSRDAATTERFEVPDGASLQSFILAGDNQAFAVGANSRGAHIARIDVRDGAVLHSVPLPLAWSQAPQLGLQMLPTDAALWVWASDGRAVRLGPATTEAPSMRFDDVYPKIDASTRVAVTGDGAMVLGWGDGALEPVESGQTYSHRYERGGDHTVRLTAIDASNLTSTATAIVHVGEEPPQGLNFIQNAFSDENWELTVTVIGFAVSAVTIVVGVLATRRGRRRVDREMKALDRIAERGRRDPFAAVKEAHERRDHLREALRKGHVEDGQYALIKAHADHVVQVLRQRILGGFVATVSDTFGRMLDVALLDGRIGGDEAEELAAAARKETGMTKPERDRLVELVRSWRTPS